MITKYILEFYNYTNKTTQKIQVPEEDICFKRRHPEVVLAEYLSDKGYQVSLTNGNGGHHRIDYQLANISKDVIINELNKPNINPKNIFCCGLPDIILLCNNTLQFIEVKWGKESLCSQEEWIQNNKDKVTILVCRIWMIGIESPEETRMLKNYYERQALTMAKNIADKKP